MVSRVKVSPDEAVLVLRAASVMVLVRVLLPSAPRSALATVKST